MWFKLLCNTDFNLKDFNISHRVNLVVIDSFSFCLSKNVLIFPSFLNDFFWIQYFYLTDFSPYTIHTHKHVYTSLYIFIHNPTAFMLINCLLSYIKLFLCDDSLFCCCFQYSVFDFNSFDYSISWCWTLIYPSYSYMSFVFVYWFPQILDSWPLFLQIDSVLLSLLPFLGFLCFVYCSIWHCPIVP